MTVTKTLSVESLVCSTAQIDGKSNVVVRARWKYTVTSDNQSVFTTGYIDIPYTPSDNFTKFDNLSESQVVQWITETLPPGYLDMVADRLAQQLSHVERPVPWATT